MDHIVHDPTGESLRSRVITPMVLLAPLTIGLLVAGIAYGWRSSQLAADIDAQAALLISDHPDGIRMASDRLCPDAQGELGNPRFSSLDVGGNSMKSTISGFGFDRAAIDLKGRLENPSGDGSGITTSGVAGENSTTDGESESPETDPADDRNGANAASSAATEDNRDDITFELQWMNETWCVADVVVR